MVASHRTPDHAAETREALCRLAHATRRLDDPRDIYPVLGDLSSALASLAQSLHQIGAFHDAAESAPERFGADVRAGRAAAYQVTWELHRAAEMTHQVAQAVDRAHEVEATIAYDIPDGRDVRDGVRDAGRSPGLIDPPAVPVQRSGPEPGFSL